MTADAGVQRNAPCPCGSGKRYKHCCGDLERSAVAPTASPLASDPAGIPEAKTQRTYVVMGSPRGGTSLLAGVLHRAGVYMGAFRTKQYEDPEFKIVLKLLKNTLAIDPKKWTKASTHIHNLALALVVSLALMSAR